MAQEYAPQYELAALSWGSVGKSAVIHRFVSNQFVDVWDPTIEDKYHKSIQIGGKEINLDILDTNGHEEYIALLDGWIRSSQGFLLMYDIGRRSSFDQIERLYQLILTNKNSSEEPAVLVGNCCDREYTRVVLKEEGFRLAERLRIPFFETSALTGENVNEVFIELVEAVASSTGPALRRHKQELKHLSTWNIKRRRELMKQIKKLETMQAGVEKAGQMTRRRSVVTSPIIQVRPSTLVADIGKLFESPELQPYDLCFLITKPKVTLSSPSSLSKRAGSIRHRASLFWAFSLDTQSEPTSPTLSPTQSADALTVLTKRLSLGSFPLGESRISCHKTIVMLRCPGLLKKHRKETRWNEELKMEEIALPDWVDTTTLRDLLQFAYTGSVGVSSRKEAEALKFLAGHCKFSDLVSSCDKLLDSSVPFLDLSVPSSPESPPVSLHHHSHQSSPLSSPQSLSPPLSPTSPSQSQASPPPGFQPESPPTAAVQDRRDRDPGRRGLFHTIGKGRARDRSRKGKSKLGEVEPLTLDAIDFEDAGTEGNEPSTKMLVQAGLKKYFDDFRQLLSPSFARVSDVSFVVEGQTFHLHRLILVSRSSYFRTFFRYEAKSTGPFEFNWMSAETFKLVTEFMYTGMVENLQLEDAGPLLVAADMLNIEGLIDICELMMGTWVANVENPVEVIELLQDSSSFGAQQLRNACIERLGSCYSQIADSAEYLALDEKTKKLVLMFNKKQSSASGSRIQRINGSSSSIPSPSSSSSSSLSSLSARSRSPPSATSSPSSSFFVDPNGGFTSRRNTF